MNVSGHTLPVEKTILGDQWQKLVDLTETGEAPALPPQEDLVAVIETMDGATKRIVVIEDNEEAARLMSRILEARDDCQVHMAHNGAAGIKLIQQIRPDLIITDLMMPGVDGFELINRVKADPNLVATPIVVVTAKELTVKEREMLAQQTDLVLQKGSFIDDSFVEKLIDHLN